MDQGEIKLYKGQDLIDTIDLAEFEAISGGTFGSLTAEYAAKDLSMVVARMKTRDKVNFKKCYYHYFLVSNLVPLLFRKPLLNLTDEILISRYHQQYPLTVKNPLTN